jgi:hypothetical protein
MTPAQPMGLPGRRGDPTSGAAMSFEVPFLRTEPSLRGRFQRRVIVRIFALASVMAAAIAVGMPSPGSGRVAKHAQQPALHPVDVPAPAKARVATGATARIADAAALERLGRFALNAFLSTLLDDSEPPAWSLAALEYFCGPETLVEVDGRPVVPGDRIPDAPFTLRWTMDACWPLGFTTFEASGIVEMRVSPARDGMSATVDARRLWIGGASVPGVPFEASMSWAPSKR